VHGNADQLLRHGHGRLVVRDEDELDAFRHFFQQRTEAADVCLVQRRVDLVEHTEGRGIQFEDREDQRRRRQRLFAAGHQVDGREALARGARHDGNAGVQQIVAGQFQARLAAAEQAPELLSEALVDLVVGRPEHGASLPIDLVHGLLQRLQRRDQVVVLFSEVLAALDQAARLFDGGQVDRTQAFDLPVQGRDRLFPGREIGRFRQFRCEGLRIQATLLQLRGNLFFLDTEFAQTQAAFLAGAAAHLDLFAQHTQLPGQFPEQRVAVLQCRPGRSQPDFGRLPLFECPLQLLAPAVQRR
jgi:hypothetical protein